MNRQTSNCTTQYVEHGRPGYWISRTPPTNPQPYWRETIVDPDGCERNRFEEREQYLADRQQEFDWIETLQPGWALDVGCGPGWWLAALPRGWRCVGVEPCEQAAKAAREQGIIIYPTTLAEAHLPPRAFDLVIHYHVIEHTPDPLAELLEVIRVLKPGGWLLLGTPDFASPCAKRFGDRYRMLHDEGHISLFTRESMYQFLTHYGFTIHGLQFPFPDRYATAETMERWNDTSSISPPWPGNWMTFYARLGRV